MPRMRTSIYKKWRSISMGSKIRTFNSLIGTRSNKNNNNSNRRNTMQMMKLIKRLRDRSKK